MPSDQIGASSPTIDVRTPTILKLALIALLCLLPSQQSQAVKLEPHEWIFFLMGADPVVFQYSAKILITEGNPVAYTGASFAGSGSPLTSGLYLGYSQTTHWDLWAWHDSTPMLETSYRPEAFWRYLPKSGPLAWIDGGFIHESNGLGGERIADSRAWNRLTLSAGIPLIGQSLVLVPRVWCILTDEGNSDIGRQIGYGELKLAVDSRIGSSRLMGDLRLRKGWSRDLSRGSIQFNLAWQPWPPRHESHFDSSSEREASQITTSSNLQNTKYVEKTVYKRGFPFTLFIQGFSGYCDTMYAYNRKEHHLRAGIGLVFE